MALDGNSSYWLLALEPKRTTLCLMSEEHDANAKRLQVVMHLGYDTLVEEVFLQKSPKPIEVEEAIIRIEDEIMRVHLQVDSSFSLCSNDDRLWEIAQRAMPQADLKRELKTVLLRDAVEFFFNRWADIVSGGAVYASEQAINKDVGAQLLILRELLHHLNFDKVLLLRDSKSD